MKSFLISFPGFFYYVKIGKIVEIVTLETLFIQRRGSLCR